MIAAVRDISDWSAVSNLLAAVRECVISEQCHTRTKALFAENWCTSVRHSMR